MCLFGYYILNFKKNKLSYNVNTVYVDDLEDSAIPTGHVTLDNYSRVDVSAVWGVYLNLD